MNSWVKAKDSGTLYIDKTDPEWRKKFVKQVKEAREIMDRIKKFREAQQDIPPDIAKVVHDHFWELL